MNIESETLRTIMEQEIISISDDLVREILLNASISTVAAFCRTEIRARRICDSERFWEMKHQIDFPSRYKDLGIVSWKDSYIDWYRIETSGLFQDTEFIDITQPVSLFKPLVFPIDITIAFSMDGEEVVDICPNILVVQNINDTYYTDVPKGIFDIQERKRGEPSQLRSKTVSVTREEAVAFVKQKIQEGYIRYNISETLQEKISIWRKLNLTSTVKMFDSDWSWKQDPENVDEVNDVDNEVDHE